MPKVHELLSSPEKWIKGRFAVDAKGNGVAVGSSDACSHCIMGAIQRCYPVLADREKIYKKLDPELRKFNRGHITSFNDNPATTWEEVHSLALQLDI